MRAATRRPGSLVSALMISSEMPSAKYSLSGSGLMLANGSTAMDRGGSKAGDGVVAPAPARASTTSAAVAGRSAALLASSRASTSRTATGTPVRTCETGRGSASSCWCTTTAMEPPVNGGWPVSISYSTQPSAYRSARPSTPASPAACSGLM